jgi:uncharacterized protein YehS (DUF1456 family)
VALPLRTALLAYKWLEQKGSMLSPNGFLMNKILRTKLRLCFSLRQKTLAAIILAVITHFSIAFCDEPATGVENELCAGASKCKIIDAVAEFASVSDLFESGYTLKANREDEGVRYLAFDISESERSIYFWKNPIVPIEIFEQRSISRESRIRYINEINDRAKLVAAAALNSGLIKDADVLAILKEMQELFEGATFIAVDKKEESKICDYTKGTNVAYVATRLPLLVHFCRDSYEMESPHTLLHEYVHIIQLKRVFLQVGLPGECQADLVTEMATAAAFQTGSIPPGWQRPGSYLSGSDCPTEKKRYDEYLKTLTLVDYKAPVR